MCGGPDLRIGYSGGGGALSSCTLGVVGLTFGLIVSQDHRPAALARTTAQETSRVQLASRGLGDHLGRLAIQAPGDGQSDRDGAVDGRCVLWIRHERGDSLALVAQGCAEADDPHAADAALGDAVVDDGDRRMPAPGHDASVDGLSAYVYG